MMYPHTSVDESKSRFSLVDRYKELSGSNAHRGERLLSEENPYWESDIQLNMSTNLLDRILNEAPANKRYALIPWKIIDNMDHKAYSTKAMIALHRENGYRIVPAARHRKTNLVSDSVYNQLDNHAGLTKKEQSDEVLHDQAIIIGENIIMERDREDHERYNEMLAAENREQYEEIGPNGRKNQDKYNKRILGMKYLKEDGVNDGSDPSIYLNNQINQLGY